MKYTKYPELKQYLKELAKKIKEIKYKRDHWWEFGTSQSWFTYEAQVEGREFRHQHIAYCLLRGRKYEQIEQPREDNKPDMIYVKMIMESYDEQKAEFRPVQYAK